MTTGPGHLKRCFSISGPHISPGLEKKLGHSEVILFSCIPKGCLAVLILCIGIRSSLEKELGCVVTMVSDGGEMQKTFSRDVF